jgi:non-ribosomal peptide synthetase component F
LEAFAPTAEQRHRVLAAGLEALALRYGAAFGEGDIHLRFTELLAEGSADRRSQKVAAEGAGLHVAVCSASDFATAGVAGADLTLVYLEEGQQCGWRYRKGTWRPGRVERLHAHYWKLLEMLLERPDAAIGEHDYLTEEEREAVTGTWAGEARFVREADSLAGLFEEVTRRFGEETAITDGELTLTYRRLNEAANRLAHYLMYFSVRPSSVVGIWMAPGVEMVVAMLAVVKLGAVVAVLDPEGAEEDVEAKWEKLGEPMVIARGPWAAKAKQRGWQVLDLERERVAIGSQAKMNPGTLVRAEHAAAIVENGEGSKGLLLLLHRSLGAAAAERCWDVRPGDAVAHLSPVGSLQSQFEIWGSLLNGARLVMAPLEAARTAKRVAEFLKRQKVNVLCLGAGRFGHWAAKAPEVFATVERLIVVGQGSGKAKAKVKSVRGRLRLVDAEGPAEATLVGALGKDTAKFILDAAGQPAAIGVVGEVCLEGPSLGWGYLDGPSVAADRFIGKNFVEGQGGRLLRTGQLAYWTESGEMVAWGAKAKQVQFNGVALNLERIEKALEKREAVREAVVVVRELAGGVQRLVAYVVLDAPVANLRRTMREELAGELPEHYLPNEFVVLEGLPLTREGQVDRALLEAPVTGPRVSGAEADAIAAEIQARSGAGEDVILVEHGWKSWWKGFWGKG